MDNILFVYILVFSFGAMIVNGLGIYVVYKKITWTELIKEYSMCFVAGVLIYVSASHLLPEANEYEKKHSIWSFLAGIALALFMMFIN